MKILPFANLVEYVRAKTFVRSLHDERWLVARQGRARNGASKPSKMEKAVAEVENMARKMAENAMREACEMRGTSMMATVARQSRRKCADQIPPKFPQDGCQIKAFSTLVLTSTTNSREKKKHYRGATPPGANSKNPFRVRGRLARCAHSC